MPGIGPRQATRLMMAMLSWTPEELADFSFTVNQLKDGNIFCRQCFNFADDSLCGICANLKRDKNKIAVVEKITDLTAMEKASIYNGVYHVLGGTINPPDGSIPENLTIKELVKRVDSLKENNTEIEVILATNPNMYGETTALYIEDLLKVKGVKVTRLGRGLSVGSSLEYVDEITLSNALKNRK